MIIQIAALDSRDMIICFKDFLTDPPELKVAQFFINEYIEKSLKMKDCTKIQILKFEDKKKVGGK